MSAIYPFLFDIGYNTNSYLQLTSMLEGNGDQTDGSKKILANTFYTRAAERSAFTWNSDGFPTMRGKRGRNLDALS